MNWTRFSQEKRILFKKNYDQAPLYARWVTHRLTPYLVYLCVKWRLRPNQVTLLSLAAGVAACAFFAAPSPWMFVAGAFFLEFYYLLDSVDGQLARYTRRFSPTGNFFDVIGNYLVQPLVFVSLAWNQYAWSGEAWFLAGGMAAALGVMWLGLMWDVRNTILIKTRSAPRPRTPEAAPERSRPHGAAFVFSVLHKLCTFPTLMNVITLCALAQWILGNVRLFGGVIAFYGVALPLVSLAKITVMIVRRELDVFAGENA